MAENAFKADWPSFALGFNTGKSKGGGKPAEEKDVRFYDYDGTLLHSYTVEEAQALAELPEFPTHEGLTCQGWNYDLATIKEYKGAVDVGALYITDDGKTRFYITIDQDYVKNVRLYISTTGDGAIINWGDGSPTETYSGVCTSYASKEHAYASMGDYVITVEPIGDCVLTLGSAKETGDYAPPVIGGRLLSGSSMVQNSMVRKIEIGRIGENFPKQCFRDMINLETINIPRGITSIGTYGFYGCNSLKAIIIPDGVTQINEYAFDSAKVNVLSIPDGVATYGKYAFQKTKIQRLVYPRGSTSAYQYIFTESELEELFVSNGVTRLNQYMFCYCKKLKKITLPDSLEYINQYCFRGAAIKSVRIPNGIKAIDSYTFWECENLEEVTIPDTVKTIGSYAFGHCKSLKSIELPDGLTNIYDSAFQQCTSIESVKIPNGAIVGNGVFYGWYKLRELDIPEGKTSLVNTDFMSCQLLCVLTLPSSITSVANGTFSGLRSLKYVDFTKHTSVPTLAGTSQGIGSSDAKFLVPAALLDEWKAATNWSTWASRIQGV